jgi:8-oxo-dGTP pyrophosphatase MutT (NUDIX family)
MRAVAASSSPFDRTSRFHLTSSALIVDPDGDRVLLRWHGRLRRWMQVGGHGDPGEFAPYAIALREAIEESGLSDLSPYPTDEPEIVQVVVVDVPESADEESHRHGDIRYLMASAHPEAIRPESPDTPLRWCGIEEARGLVEEENLRQLLDRTEQVLNRGARGDS